MAYIYDMAATWAAAGTTFTAIKMNVTDTASAAGSLLMDLQVGGVSRFSVSKSALLTLGSGNGRFGINAGQDWSTSFTFNGTSLFSLNDVGQFGLVGTNAALVFGSGSGDTFLRRDAAGTLAQRNGVNAQSFRLYGTYTDASNYERLNIGYSSGVSAFVIQREQAGTGAQRALYLNGGAHVLGIGAVPSGAYTWTIAASGGHFLAGTDNTYDIGASGATRPRFLYLGGGSLTGSQTDSSVTISPTWNTTGAPSAIKLNVTDTASAAGSLLMDLQVGGVSRFSVSKTGSFTAGSGVSSFSGSLLASANAKNVEISDSAVRGVTVKTGVSYSFSSGNADGTIDLRLFRDDSNTLAQRNGVNAQAFRVYNTFTDASNYERGFVRWTSNEFQIGSENAGTGAARDVKLVPAMNGGGNVAGQRLLLGTATTLYEQFGYLTFFSAGNGVSILQNLIVGGNVEQSAGKFFQMAEGTAPAAPAANGVRIYAEDNGAGKTRLMARFATGAAVQIAIEP